MAFRTDLAVEAIENHKSAAALPHVRQSDRMLEASPYTRYAFSQRMPAARLASRRGRYLTLELDALIRREEDAFPRACKGAQHAAARTAAASE